MKRPRNVGQIATWERQRDAALARIDPHDVREAYRLGWDARDRRTSEAGPAVAAIARAMQKATTTAAAGTSGAAVSASEPARNKCRVCRQPLVFVRDEIGQCLNESGRNSCKLFGVAQPWEGAQ